MRNISSSSWHYRLRAKVFMSTPVDLCSYFWSTVAALLALFSYYVARGLATVFRPVGRLGRFKNVLPFALITIAVGVIIVGLAVFVWALLYNTTDFLIGLLVVAGWLLGIAVVAVLFVFTCAGFSELRKRYRRKHPPTARLKAVPDEPEGDSSFMIFWSFLKAKKRKVCPLISVDGRAPGQSEEQGYEAETP